MGLTDFIDFICFTSFIQGDTAGSSKPPADFKTKVPFWPGLTWPGKSGTFVLKSTGGLELPAVSSCNCSCLNEVSLNNFLFEEFVRELKVVTGGREEL